MTSDADRGKSDQMPHSVVHALRRKYQRMLEMRRLDESGVEHDARVLMRELAAEFPGSLREIDVLPLETITERLRALEDVMLHGSEVPVWMRCVADYHAVLRAALRIKRMELPRHDIATASAILGRTYVAGEGEPTLDDFDPATLDAVLNPGDGRLNPWVYLVLERRHGISAGELDQLLFPAPQKTQ